MGRMKDKLMELEDAGIIVFNTAINAYVLVDQNPEPVPFDLSEYLFKLLEYRANKYTQEEKEHMYLHGQYQFPAPPACTAFWTTYSWIKYIDAHGKWGPT